MQKPRHPLAFIFITVLVDCIGVRIIYPVTATIIAEVSHVHIHEAIIYSGWMMTAYALMQLIFSPLIAGLSDRYGRRPVLLLSLCGLAIDYVFLSLAHSLPLLFLGRIIAGICGASLTTSFAYVADISPAEKRAQHFGLIGAAVGLGFVTGPLLGGLLSELGTRVPFIVAACLALLNLLYVYFMLPESLAYQNRRPFDLRRANPLGAFVQIRNNRPVRMLLLVLFLIFMGAQALPSVWPFYTKYLYGWSDLEIGYSMAFVGLVLAFVKGGLIKWTQEKLGPVRPVYIGLLLNMLGLGLFALAGRPWTVYVFALVYCLGGIATPAIQGIIAAKTSPDKQGELQGMITSLMSLANILAPLIMTNLFFLFTGPATAVHFPGAPFALTVLFMLSGFLLSIKSLRIAARIAETR